jgi:hypothetical protein
VVLRRSAGTRVRSLRRLPFPACTPGGAHPGGRPGSGDRPVGGSIGRGRTSRPVRYLSAPRWADRQRRRDLFPQRVPRRSSATRHSLAEISGRPQRTRRNDSVAPGGHVVERSPEHDMDLATTLGDSPAVRVEGAACAVTADGVGYRYPSDSVGPVLGDSRSNARGTSALRADEVAGVQDSAGDSGTWPPDSTVR